MQQTSQQAHPEYYKNNAYYPSAFPFSQSSIISLKFTVLTAKTAADRPLYPDAFEWAQT
jgi:hypothetical protein